jgi:spermidine/putrescine transport system permease protein
MSGIAHGVADDDGSPQNRPGRRPQNRPTAAWKMSEGLVSALPVIVLLILGFFGPMLLVLVYSFMPRGSFTIRRAPSIENYVDIVEQNFYISFSWSLFLALITVVILLVICYPLALALKRMSTRRANLLTLLIVAPLFVAENIRLQGWVLFFDKGGFLDGGLEALIGVGTGSLVNNVPSVIFGIVYIYLPFMLFPILLGLANVPKDAQESAYDLGASRWRVFRDIELPLAMPGIMIGGLLCFVISLGAFSEAKFLGKGVIVTIAQDIESAFTFGQNWPRGSALSVLLIVLAGSAVFLAMRRINLERMLAKR